MKFQRTNPYNKFLPYSSDLEQDADKYLDEIKLNFKAILSKSKLVMTNLDKWMTNLQKYIALYGLRFSLEDHVWFIKAAYALVVTSNVDPLSLEKFCKILISLVKKKYLLVGSDLILDWRPLYEGKQPLNKRRSCHLTDILFSSRFQV